ncbi:hypothetical protein ACFQ1L_26765 [Phytohabitans flavus]
MSGGEALLRASLVRDLAEAARRVGTRALAMSGMYFARTGEGITPALRRAIESLDHLTASYDRFHEREVPRRDMFRALHQVRELVPGVSMQLTGEGPDDPYLVELIEDVRREFADEVPMLVTTLASVGRAREWFTTDAAPVPAAGVEPCFQASWPLVGYDGTVLACPSRHAAAPHRPAHLVLGDSAVDSWPVLRQRALTTHLLRGVRMFGPLELRRRFGAGDGTGNYCGTCSRLGDSAELDVEVTRFLESPKGRALEAAALAVTKHAGDQAYLGTYGVAAHRELATLGWR